MNRISITLTSAKLSDLILGHDHSLDTNLERKEDSLKISQVDFTTHGLTILDNHLYQVFTLNLIFNRCTFNDLRTGSLSEIRVLNKKLNWITFDECQLNTLKASYCQKLEAINSKINKILLSHIPQLHVSDGTYDELDFQHCTLQNGLLLEAQNLLKVRFNQCVVDQGISIKGCEIKHLGLEHVNQTNGKTYIKGSTISEQLKIHNLKTKACSLQNNFFPKLELTESPITELKVSKNSGEILAHSNTIERCSINGNKSSVIDIDGNKVSGSLSLSGNKENPKIKFENQDLSAVNITNTKKHGILDIKHCNGTIFPDLTTNHFESIHLSDIDIDMSGWALNGTECTSLLINNVKCRSLDIIFDKIDSFNVSLATFQKNLNLKVKSIHTLSIDNCSSNILNLTGDYIDFFKLANSPSEALYVDINTTKIKNARFEENIITELSVGESNIEEFYIRNTDTETSIDKVKCVLTTSRNFDIYHARVEELILDTVSFKSFNFNNGELKNATIENISNASIDLLGGSYEDDSNSNLTFRLIGESTFTVKDCEMVEFRIRNFQHDDDFKDSLKFSITDSKRLKFELNDFYKGVFDSKYNEYQHWNLKNDSLGGSNISVGVSFLEDQIDMLEVINSKIDTFKSIQASIDNGNIKSSYINDLVIDSNHPRLGEESNIRNLTFSGKCNIPNFKLSKLSIDMLCLKEFNPFIFTLEQINIKNLILQNFRRLEKSKIEFNFINVPKPQKIKAEKIEWTDSDLTGTNFNSCYFDSFEELVAQSSKLDGINCTVTTWPQIVNSYEDDSRKKKHHFEIREACRQLKLAMAEHQDRVGELQFHALEMDAHRKIVSKTPWKFNDFISLLAGATNKFGRSWTRPIGLLFVLMLLNYLLILWSHYGWATPLCELYLSTFSSVDYFQLFNPTHRIDHLGLDGSKNGFTASFDFLSRIVSAFFIYQIVTAFRKFRK